MSPVLPGPAPHPVLRRRANAHVYATDPVGYSSRLYHEHGPVSGLVRGDDRQVFAFGPEHNRTVMTSGDVFHTVLEHSIPERIRRARRGIGLLNMNGPAHRVARRMAAPSFRPQVIAQHAELIAELAAAEVDTWAAGEPFDLAAAMRRLTLRIACRCLFGVDIAASADPIGVMVQDMLALRYFDSSIRYFPFDVPGAPYRRLLTVIRRLDDTLAEIVATRRAQDGQPDLLGSLLSTRDGDGRQLDDDQLVGHLTTLLVAGHETSSNTLAWAFLLLSQHPGELDTVLASVPGRSPGRPADAAAAVGDATLDRVLKEVLRLLPPGPLTARIAVAPTQIGGYEIPAWCQVMTSKFVTHRDPVVFPDPLRFRPGRWESTRPSLYQYLPYGAGAHACLGAAFADLEMKIVLATVLGRYRLEPGPGTEGSRQVGLMRAPRGAIPVVARPREAAGPVARVQGDVHEMVDMDGAHRWRLGW